MSDPYFPESLQKCNRQYPELGEVIRFGYDLFEETNRIHPDLDLTSFRLTPQIVKVKLKEGFPLIDTTEIHLPSDQFKKAFLRISQFVAEKRSPLKEPINALVRMIKSGKMDITRLAVLSLNQNPGMDHLKQIDEGLVPILNFLIRISLKPFGQAYGSALGRYLSADEETWLQPVCPICGSYPQLAYIEGDEGRRFLLCSWCDSPWVFPRIKCPSCQNTNQNDLHYFSLEKEKEEKEKDRISVCQRCKKYIKTLDIRNRAGKKASDLLIDDLATIHLDLLAEREGYERITRHLLAI